MTWPTMEKEKRRGLDGEEAFVVEEAMGEGGIGRVTYDGGLRGGRGW